MDEYRSGYHLHDEDLPAEALRDHMKPPEQPILVHCIHCGEEYDSWRMIWVPLTEEEELARETCSDLKGFWCCPIEGCTGKGFTIDIWPADPDYVDPETGEKYWHDDEPMIEGHEPDCDCVECEMAWHEAEAQFDREMEEHQRKVESGEIPPPGPVTDEEIPF
jgi:hypothetical protein